MKQLLLLHGAVGSRDQLMPLKEVLSLSYQVHTINFLGHGGEEIPGEFSIEKFATEVLNYLDTTGIETTAIFGYSMGGYVGLYLAKHHPTRVNAVITLATKFDWNETTAAKEAAMLQPEKIEEKIPKFAEQLKQRHHPADWKMVLEKTAAMLTAMGKNNPLVLQDYQSIQCPVLLMLGDRDKMVTIEETVEVFKQLPNAQLAVLPNAPHPIEQVELEQLCFFIKKFLG